MIATLVNGIRLLDFRGEQTSKLQLSTVMEVILEQSRQVSAQVISELMISQVTQRIENTDKSLILVGEPGEIEKILKNRNYRFCEFYKESTDENNVSQCIVLKNFNYLPLELLYV